MKGLRLYIMPFAPDQSGACAVLYELGGITVIVDAGGCAGNVCGFDEPRWFRQKSLIFSAGLRDMDAILGRDEVLLKKLADVCAAEPAPFAALVGTPVPAVIATDYRGLKRLAKKQLPVPLLAVDTDGTALCDVGASKAYVELFKTFAEEVRSTGCAAGMDISADAQRGARIAVACASAVSQNTSVGATIAAGDEAQVVPLPSPRRILGVLGVTPLDTGRLTADELVAALRMEGWDEVWCYGLRESGMDALRRAGEVTENLVVAPSGLAAARYLQQRFGTPYRCAWPLAAADMATGLLASRQVGATNTELYHTAAAGLLPPEASEPKPQATPEQLAAFVRGLAGKRVLVVHQQVLANAVRDYIGKMLADATLPAADVTVATWFLLDAALAAPQDVRLQEEDEFMDFVRNGQFDCVLGDPAFAAAIPFFTGTYVPLPHVAVSGKL